MKITRQIIENLVKEVLVPNDPNLKAQFEKWQKLGNSGIAGLTQFVELDSNSADYLGWFPDRVEARKLSGNPTRSLVIPMAACAKLVEELNRVQNEQGNKINQEEL